MPRRVGIMLSTNDPDNGCDTGRVTAVTAIMPNGETVLDLVHADAGYSRGGIKYRLGLSWKQSGYLFLSRRRFRIFSHKDWYGNWCWRLVTVDIQTANEIFRYLHSMGKWNCEGGLVKFYNMWEGRR